MKSSSIRRGIPCLAGRVGGWALLTGTLQSAPFLYSPGDLILAFRQTGNASD